MKRLILLLLTFIFCEIISHAQPKTRTEIKTIIDAKLVNNPSTPLRASDLNSIITDVLYYPIDSVFIQNDTVYAQRFDKLRFVGVMKHGTITSISTGYGLIGGPITSTGSIYVDTFSLTTKASRDKLKDSLWNTIGFQMVTDHDTVSTHAIKVKGIVVTGTTNHSNFGFGDNAMRLTDTLSVDVDSHGIMDLRVIRGSAIHSNGYASFDAIAQLVDLNGRNYDHVSSFQARPTINTTGSMAQVYGGWSSPDINNVTLTDVYGWYHAGYTSFIATSHVTNETSFYAEGTSRATNNYGFVGNQSAAATAWNLYMKGTAGNYLKGFLAVGTTDNKQRKLYVDGSVGFNKDSITSTSGNTYYLAIDTTTGKIVRQTVSTGSSYSAGYGLSLASTTFSVDTMSIATKALRQKGLDSVQALNVQLAGTQIISGAKTFTGQTTFSNNVIFSANNTYNIGSSSNAPQHVYVGSNLYVSNINAMNISGGNTIRIGNDASVQAVKLYTNAGTNGFVLDNSSNVGINGITSPTAGLHVGASTTSRASLRIPAGTAPTSPNDGDIWNDGSDIKVRLGGVTYTLQKL